MIMFLIIILSIVSVVGLFYYASLVSGDIEYYQQFNGNEKALEKMQLQLFFYYFSAVLLILHSLIIGLALFMYVRKSNIMFFTKYTYEEYKEARQKKKAEKEARKKAEKKADLEKQLQEIEKEL
ncbi:MAG: hypothetical protein J6K52_04785 [Clostridia bacterium]|nr:hypothetical protein [Clostridia bacterium]